MRAGFGAPENLGPRVNSAENEYAPMLSPDGRLLLFSSDRPGGAGRHDLYTARAQGRGFVTVAPPAGALNTAADEFAPSFLADTRTRGFARAPDTQDAPAAPLPPAVPRGPK